MNASHVERQACEPKPSRGFTLLEVLLTSLLASVVLIALWSLSDIYMRLFVSGRNKIEETQLARSLTSQVARDVAQVVQRPEEPRSDLPPARMPVMAMPPMPRGARPGIMGLSGGPTAEMLPPPSRSGAESLNSGPNDLARSFDDSVPRFGLFGTSDALRLIILQIDPRTTRAPTDLSEVLPEPGRLRIPFASELRTVEYSVGESRESTELDQRHPPGLIRREWAWEHWIGIRSANLLSVGGTEAAEMLPKGAMGWTAEDAVAFENQEYLHVPQVKSLEFNYYDGDTWDIEWNSWERGRLPVLVEVLLEFEINAKPKKLAAEAEEAELASESASSTDGSRRASDGTIYRRLIHLPFANQVKPSADPEMAPVARLSPRTPDREARQP